jgi:hypothetical protein
MDTRRARFATPFSNQSLEAFVVTVRIAAAFVFCSIGQTARSYFSYLRANIAKATSVILWN